MKNNKLHIAILLLIIIASSINANAQRWKRYRYNISYGIGATNFLGDLGGANAPGTHFAADIEYGTTRPVVYISGRYKLMERVALSVNLLYTTVSGADSLSDSRRTPRNLHFKSSIFEFSTEAEFHIIKEKASRRYAFKYRRKFRAPGVNTYIFAGIGAAYFNPKANYNDIWVNLQPLGTEGQGLPGGPEFYSRVTMVIPMGIAFNYNYDRQKMFGIKFGYRYTFSDYIDDVSDSYYDNDIIRSSKGDMAADLADPRIKLIDPRTITDDNPNGNFYRPAQHGSKWRGDPSNNDVYFFVAFTYTYKLRVRKGGLPKF